MSRFSAPKGNLEKLAANSFRAINSGKYEYEPATRSHTPLSLRKAILASIHAAIITEIKYSSPSKGEIASKTLTPTAIASEMVQGGACALSVLTQPYLFEGSVENLVQVRKIATVPLIMKDIVVSRVQIEAGKKAGADCVLLIKAVFDRNLAEESFESLCEYAQKQELQVLAEAHSEDEYRELLRSNLPIVGINNRNLDDLTIDADNTEKLIAAHGKGKSIVVAESGISSAVQIRKLHSVGVDAFLIGTYIMSQSNIKATVSELTKAI